MVLEVLPSLQGLSLQPGPYLLLCPLLMDQEVREVQLALWNQCGRGVQVVPEFLGYQDHLHVPVCQVVPADLQVQPHPFVQGSQHDQFFL